MKRFYCSLFCALLSLPAFSAVINGQDTTRNTPPVRVTDDGQVVTALGECEDETNSLCRVEQRFSYCADKTADASCKASAGFVHTISCAGTDAAATAGSVALLDSTSAGAGTTVKTIGFAAAYLQPFTLTIDATFSTGIYLDFTTTADVGCSVSYR